MRELDALTGEVLNEAEGIIPYSRPFPCGNDTRFCVEGMHRELDKFALWQLEGSKLVESTAEPMPAPSRSLGKGVYSTIHRPHREDEMRGAEKLFYVTDKKVQWQRPYADVFGQTASSDWGWRWYHEDHDDWPLIGVGFVDGDPGAPGPIGGRIMALARADGSTLWAKENVEECGATDSTIALCEHGGGTVQWKDSKPTYANLDASLRGYDPTTGEELWQVKLDEKNWTSGQGTPFQSPDGTRIAFTDGALASIELDSGEVTPLPEDAALACNESAEAVTLRVGGVSEEYYTDYYSYPCDADREPVEQFSRLAVEAAGTKVGDFRVVVLKDGVAAYKVSSDE